MTRQGRLAGVVAVLVVIAGVQYAAPTPASAAPMIVAAAGDIAKQQCTSGADCHHRRTADQIIAMNPVKVIALGDLQYDNGALSAFNTYYDATWGRFKAKTLPAPGNHEYNTPDASGYFTYFGQLARPNGRSYYSVDVGNWHIISLNSEIDRGANSDQVNWLRNDLNLTTKMCVAAFWHRPLFSSGEHGNANDVRPFWDVLYAHRVELVLNGHDHDYERFARMRPDGTPDTATGIHEVVAGTGGAELRDFLVAKPNSAKRIAKRFGVVKLFLDSSSYRWQFIAANGDLLDSTATFTCH